MQVPDLAEHEADMKRKASRLAWEIEAQKLVHPGGDGYVPHGYALVKRERFPFPNRAYATVMWVVQPDSGVSFSQGHYDLTFMDAIEDFNKRMKGSE